MINADASVVVHPTTVEGIPITGLVFGFITGLLTTNGIINALGEAIKSSGTAAPDDMPGDKRLHGCQRAKSHLYV